MAFVLYAGERELDLGDPFAVLTVFAELGRVAGDEEQWAELFGVPHTDEEDLPADYVAAVADQARGFLEAHPDVSADAKEVLGELASLGPAEKTTTAEVETHGELWTPETRVKVWDEFVAKAAPLETTFAREVYRALVAVGEDVATRIRSVKTPHDALTVVPVPAEIAPLFRRVAERQLPGILEAGWKHAARLLKARRRQKDLEFDFDLELPNLRDYMRHRPRQYAADVSETTITRIRQQLELGLLDDETIDELADRLIDYLGMAEGRARTIARTEVVSASNLAARETYREGGADGQEWLTARDERVRGTKASDEFDHVSADGQVVGLDEAFEVSGEMLEFPGDPNGSPGNIINCFPGDVLVSSPWPVERAYRRPFAGRLVRIRTAHGHLLAGTENHPVLTRSGWVQLGRLQVGDSVVCTCGSKWGIGRDPDVERAPTAIEEVYVALAQAPAQRQRILVGPMQFHGDGCHGHVDVVTPDRQLQHGSDSPHFEPASEVPLVGPGVLERALPLRGALDQLSLRTHAPSDGRMGGLDQGTPFFWGESRHAQPVRHRAVPDGNAGRPEAGLDRRARQTEASRETELGLTGFVATDEIIEVDVEAFRGHVYNLQTATGWYIANSIPVHNCRCTILPVLEGVPGGESEEA